MSHIPVSFEFRGQTIAGELVQVMGAGSNATFHLSIPDKEDPKATWYWGKLRYANGWVFDPTPKTGELAEQAEFFGWVVTAWYDSHS